MALDEVTRRLGEHEHAEGENTSPDELDGNRDSVRAMIVTRLGALVDYGSKEETNGLKAQVRNWMLKM
jgi:hypothetical protein